MPHDLELDHEHEAANASNAAEAAEQAAIAQLIWEQDTLALCTVGIDIGSSTSHLLFARVTLRRQTEGLSSRFTVVNRQVLWRSPIVLTPFARDGSIDAHALQHFIAQAYADAGLRRSDVDSGAVILTGEAIKRHNARAIDEIFAGEAGKFVCATAGHRLECTLAAQGSGAVALSRRRRQVGLHVDIGGGTTKLALIDSGEVVSVAAFAVGGRLLAQDAAGAWTRIDDSARRVAAALGIAATPAALADAAARDAIVQRLASLAVDQIVGADAGARGDGPADPLAAALALTEPLARNPAPDFVSISGGVAEYLFGHESADHGDIARPLAAAIASGLAARLTVPVVEPAERIRATVIGASQFTVQVSGKTVFMPDRSLLPLRNVPVVHLGRELDDTIDSTAIAAAFTLQAQRMDLAPTARLALAFRWRGDPEYARLLALARGIEQFAAPTGWREQPLLLVMAGDIGATLGRILRDELGLQAPLLSLDGIELQPLDYVDIGDWLDPPGVVPLVIKSLLFGDAAPVA